MLSLEGAKYWSGHMLFPIELTLAWMNEIKKPDYAITTKLEILVT
jgi:hypothetical protein